jgi:LysR family transcriptional regulator, nod-box dependent transcriptional activator
MLAMFIMLEEHIRNVDLNLLLALDVLLEERHVTRAAARLGLTQSATSRLLGRLRTALGDPLFVRTSRGLVPTQRARELTVPLRQVVQHIGRLLVEQPGFDPRTARRRFRIAAVDYAHVVLIGPLVAALAREAPLVDLELRQPSAESDRDLESGGLDLLVTPRQDSGPGIVWSTLFRDRYIGIVSAAQAFRRLTPARFAALDHVLVAPRERAGGVVDEVLATLGLTRRVAVQIPTFLLLPHVLTGDRIATIPARMAAQLAARHPLRTVRLPIDVPGVVMCQAWHEVHRHDPAHRWLRTRLMELGARLPPADGRRGR